MTAALGVVQILAWGTTYYLPAILSPAVAADTGWPTLGVTGGLSLGLLVAGLAATRTGGLIQRHGGRPVLASAMALNAAGLAVLALAPGLPIWLLGWIILGLGMGAGLYDAAFSALGRIFGAGARRAITRLTLWGGFASTVCWPLSTLLVEALGWRATCATYAAMHILVTLPLCLRGLPRQAIVPVAAPAPASGTTPSARFWLLAVAMTVSGLLATILSVHLPTLLTGQGLSLAAAVAAGALIGPAQVAARIVEMASGGRHHPVWTMLGATVLIAVGLATLRLGAPAALAIVAYGAGNGVRSIAQGTLPLALFGPSRYALIMGRLALPALLAAAAAPLLGQVAIEQMGADGALTAMALLALVPVGCVALLWGRRA